MIKISLISLCCLLSLSFKCPAVSEEEQYKKEMIQKRQQEFAEHLKSMDVAIHFYGKVVDQFDEPVADANVCGHISHFDPVEGIAVKKVILKTSSNGLFELHDTGSLFIIVTIEKSGYEFLRDKNKRRAFEYWDRGKRDFFVADTNNLFVFNVREKGEPAYLIHHSTSRRLEKGNLEYDLDLSWKWIDENGEIHHSKGTYGDLRIKVNFDEEISTYHILFTTPDVNSGIIISDELLYAAPPDGYKPEIKIDLDIHKVPRIIKKHLYIKTRGGNLYSRIDLELVVRNARPSSLRVKTEIWTNPSGSRNLEYDSKFTYMERHRRYAVRKRRYEERRRKLSEEMRLEDEKRAKRRAAQQKLK